MPARDLFTGIPSKIHDARVLKLLDVYEVLPGYAKTISIIY